MQVLVIYTELCIKTVYNFSYFPFLELYFHINLHRSFKITIYRFKPTLLKGKFKSLFHFCYRMVYQNFFYRFDTPLFIYGTSILGLSSFCFITSEFPMKCRPLHFIDKLILYIDHLYKLPYSTSLLTFTMWNYNK